VNNLIAWNLQIAVLVAVAAVLPSLVRMKMPGARVVFWQAVLLASIALPLLRPWRAAVTDGLVTITSRVTRATSVGHGFHLPVNLIAMVLGAGIAARLAWLSLGLLRLRRYRRASVPFDGDSVRISSDVANPVTFGFFRPIVLLPADFPDMDASMREAILCHERIHVKRHDWLFALGEEVIRALFWFHPGIWWVLGEIQLAREQVVDRAVIEMTGLPDRYVDALLSVAGAAQLDLAPAPLFLRRRHLKKRVYSLLKEARMSKAKSLSALATGLGMVAAACWFVTGAIPLTAAPETPKIRVGGNVQASKIVSQPKPVYPPEAKAARIQGTVQLLVEIAADGKVKDVSVVSGPPELVKSAVEAVSQWAYQTTLLNGEPVEVITTVDVNYTLRD
jgi:TonB family protein